MLQLFAEWVIALIVVALCMRDCHAKALSDEFVADLMMDRVGKLTEEQRTEIWAFRKLPIEQAIKVYTFLEGIHHEEAKALARETLPEVSGWREYFQQRVAELGYPKSPQEVFGPKWEELALSKYRDPSLSGPERFRQGGEIMNFAGKVESARFKQGKLIDLVGRIDRPETVLLLVPYLFDRSEGFLFDRDVAVSTPDLWVKSTFIRLWVTGIPPPPWPLMRDEDEARYFDQWREWWIRYAPAFGARPPSSIHATPEEVAALNAEAHPGTNAEVAVKVAAIAPPSYALSVSHEETTDGASPSNTPPPTHPSSPKTPGVSSPPNFGWIVTAIIAILATGAYLFRKRRE